jgi:hypothetical protein
VDKGQRQIANPPLGAGLTALIGCIIGLGTGYSIGVAVGDGDRVGPVGLPPGHRQFFVEIEGRECVNTIDDRDRLVDVDCEGIS